ncbi:MAG: sulfite exporter TauE/SafE family protein [Bacteroidales bacterium]|nr:sulfite exporter TauE/SafE family protein [Bacteroidales bacterium]MBN2763355.1 sulfite exporter TauE/SafE family protein [Bacteroidales bacterium]
MASDINILLATAASVGFIHTVAGPDHYLPFVVIAKARKWSIAKTSLITFLCGIGHVGSSILLGSLGIGLGVMLSKIKGIESFRGDLAAWAFVIFGLVYMVWGIYRAVKNKPHSHVHYHTGEGMHEHVHTHENNHDHIHRKEKAVNLTPWVLIIIFVLGPCEVLIPMLMYPAAEHGTMGIIMVSTVFAITTIATMLVIVLLLTTGFKRIPFGKLERYTHAIAGAIILLSGIAILLGL